MNEEEKKESKNWKNRGIEGNKKTECERKTDNERNMKRKRERIVKVILSEI